MRVTKSEVIEIIKASGLTVDVDTLAHDALLRDNGVDSLDMSYILLSMEERYGIKIPDEDIPKLQTINSIAEYLNNR